MTESDDGRETTEEAVARIAQVRAIRDQVRAGGLWFEAYLPPDLADWLLGLIERGDFVDPGEAVFVILGEHQELEPHADLRAEIQRRADQAALDDPRPGIPQEKMNERLQELIVRPRSEPAVWPRRKS